MLYSSLLFIHIVSGFIALISGIVAMLTPKGGVSHIRAGLVFTYAMYGVGISSITLSLIKTNTFLLSIGVFATYMTYMGKVSIIYYRTKESRPFRVADRLPALLALLVAVFMIVEPMYQMLANGQLFISILGVFGIILLIMAIQDLMIQGPGKQLKVRDKKWILRHIGMTGGAYISTFTAFLVTNIQIQPAWIIWLFPTFIGTILISRSIISWKKKLKITS